MMREKLKEILIQDEGMVLTPYLDSVGKLTIGVGRNISDNGITEDEALYILDNDIQSVLRFCEVFFRSIWNDLSEARKIVLASMVFNLGGTRIQSFKRMIQALYDKDYHQASAQMLDSKWAKQVKGRAVRLARIMASDNMDEGFH